MNTENGNSKKNKSQLNKIKVKHDFSEVTEGVEYIMTLKDKNVLEGNDDDLDVLENEILIQNKNLKLSEKRTLQKEKDQYLKDEILSKYDHEESKIKGFVITHENKKARIKNSEINLDLELDENENPVANENNFSKEELNSIKEKLKGLRSFGNAAANRDKELVELGFEKKFATDYLTPEEFKPKEFKKNKVWNANNKKVKNLEESDKDGNNAESGFDTDRNWKKLKINNSDFYNNAEDEYDELNKFLEKQRNLVNKNKIGVQAPEEKIKSLLMSTSNNEEAKGIKVELDKDGLKDFEKIKVKQDVNEDSKQITVPIVKKNKQDIKG
jgi:hypothetical protein